MNLAEPVAIVGANGPLVAVFKKSTPSYGQITLPADQTFSKQKPTRKGHWHGPFLICSFRRQITASDLVQSFHQFCRAAAKVGVWQGM